MSLSVLGLRSFGTTAVVLRTGWLEVVVGRSGPTAAETAVLQPIVEAMIAGHPGGGAVQLQLPVLSQQGPSGSQGSVTVRAAALLAFSRERCMHPITFGPVPYIACSHAALACE